MRKTTIAITALAAVLAGAAPAQAGFGITSFGGSATDTAGDRVSQAGAHPDVRTVFTLPTRNGDLETDGSLRNARVELPPGLAGDPTGVPVCANSDFYDDYVLCPAETQVGTIAIKRPENARPDMYALYRVTPPRGVVARFAANASRVVIALDVRVGVGSDGEYRVFVSSTDASVSQRVAGVDVALWGVPADPAHDEFRLAPGSFGEVRLNTPVASSSPRAALVAAPTSCPVQPLRTTLTVESWEEPGVEHSAWFDHDFDGFPIHSEGCERLAFEPSMAIATTTSAPDAPTGLDVDLTSVQDVGNPDGLVGAHLRDVKVGLADGLTINPGSANGLQACTDAQLGLGTNDVSTCPDGAKIGTVTATTPVLEEALEGGVYLRSQASDDPESGDMFRLALVIRNDDRGIVVKVPGSAVADAGTGRLTASFEDNPQFPIENVKLHLKGGPRAPLATPASCGAKAITANLTSWAGHARGLPNTANVDCTPGLGGFAPTLDAGTVDPIAGGFSPFALTIAKPDGNAALNGLRMELPQGLLAKLKGNLGTQVGTVKAFAGPGSNPFTLPGKVYLEGPYGDAPYSLRAVVPAKAGPFDLGEVVVRQKVYVDPNTAQVRVVSDPLPTIVKGVPARLQRLDVDVDKPGFIVNPTSCERKTIAAVLGAVDGQTAPITNKFQVSDCARLGFTPRLSLALIGKKQTRTGQHPGVKARVVQNSGDANIAKAVVALPKSVALDPANARALCEFEDGTKPDLENHCPKGSIVGRATAVTPLLDRPLRGNVYFVKNVERNPKTGALIRKLPMIVVALRGQIAINLKGKSSTTKTGRLVNTFTTVPDAPVKTFNLNIAGGKTGILTVTRTAKRNLNLCTARQVADVELDGHNSKAADFATAVKTPCGKASKAKAGKKSKHNRSKRR